ncbi:MAG: hypothetical protein H0W83_06495 [Planctomycetes bacterium]|nr:hypothetical protein [Planctomycetota bacterium]
MADDPPPIQLQSQPRAALPQKLREPPERTSHQPMDRLLERRYRAQRLRHRLHLIIAGGGPGAAVILITTSMTAWTHAGAAFAVGAILALIIDRCAWSLLTSIVLFGAAQTLATAYLSSWIATAPGLYAGFGFFACSAALAGAWVGTLVQSREQ